MRCRRQRDRVRRAADGRSEGKNLDLSRELASIGLYSGYSSHVVILLALEGRSRVAGDNSKLLGIKD